ncbi:MAG: LamG domain-containing protein, partial [Bacteroidota bacterium]|nr:LamG domain-containing protein [Bacteroidota bacterium]
MKLKNSAGKWIVAASFGVALVGCQKMDRPALTQFPQDTYQPGGPLKFYTAFDGTTNNPLMNAVDSIRATFPSSNPLTLVDGVSGKALQGENKKFVKFAKPNDWAQTAKSFTISFWYKKNGQTQNNTGGNGPEYIFSFKSNNEHWTGGNMALFLEGNNTAAAVKMFVVDKDKKNDPWFTWENAETIPGLLDNKWHHMALVYSAANSTMILYVDGVANPKTKTPNADLKDLDLDDSKLVEFRIGAGPGDKFDSDDWLSSTFKGNIDQFRMYTEPLSAEQVRA